MNLLKRWRGHEADGAGRGLARRPGGEAGLTQFRQEMDRVFDRVWRDFDQRARDAWAVPSALSDSDAWQWPAVDMAEDEHSITLRADVPGLGPEDLNVEIVGDSLTIRGSRQDEWNDDKHGVRRRERRFGSFVRTVPLPPYVDPDKIDAKYEKGTLSITLPKVPGRGPKRVTVKAS